MRDRFVQAAYLTLGLLLLNLVRSYAMQKSLAFWPFSFYERCKALHSTSFDGYFLELFYANIITIKKIKINFGKNRLDMVNLISRRGNQLFLNNFENKQFKVIV